MDKQIIGELEKCLGNFNGKSLIIQQIGFITSQCTIDVLIYKIQNNILNLRDKNKNIYVSINLNKVCKVEIGRNKMILFLDEGIEIKIEMIKSSLIN